MWGKQRSRLVFLYRPPLQPHRPRSHLDLAGFYHSFALCYSDKALYEGGQKKRGAQLPHFPTDPSLVFPNWRGAQWEGRQHWTCSQDVSLRALGIGAKARIPPPPLLEPWPKQCCCFIERCGLHPPLSLQCNGSYVLV